MHRKIKNLGVVLLAFGGVCASLPSSAQGERGRSPVISAPLLGSESSWGGQHFPGVTDPTDVSAQSEASLGRVASNDEGLPAQSQVSTASRHETPKPSLAGEITKVLRQKDGADMAGLTHETPAQPAFPSDAVASTWTVLQGASLHDGLKRWTDAMGYELVWDAPYDFPIRARLAFGGDFVAAVTKLFDAYRDAGRPLQVDIYKEQRLVRVFPQDDVAYE